MKSDDFPEADVLRAEHEISCELEAPADSECMHYWDALVRERVKHNRTAAERDDLLDLLGPKKRPLTPDELEQRANAVARMKEKWRTNPPTEEQARRVMEMIWKICPACGGEIDDHAYPDCEVARLQERVKVLVGSLQALHDVTCMLGVFNMDEAHKRDGACAVVRAVLELASP